MNLIFYCSQGKCQYHHLIDYTCYIWKLITNIWGGRGKGFKGVEYVTFQNICSSLNVTQFQLKFSPRMQRKKYSQIEINAHLNFFNISYLFLHFSTKKIRKKLKLRKTFKIRILAGKPDKIRFFSGKTFKIRIFAGKPVKFENCREKPLKSNFDRKTC